MPRNDDAQPGLPRAGVDGQDALRWRIMQQIGPQVVGQYWSHVEKRVNEILAQEPVAVSEWVSFAERHPPKYAVVLIAKAGAGTVALAEYCGRFEYDGTPHLNGAGFSGHEWEWDFTPTHWALFSTSMPGDGT